MRTNGALVHKKAAMEENQVDNYLDQNQLGAPNGIF